MRFSRFYPDIMHVITRKWFQIPTIVFLHIAQFYFQWQNREDTVQEQ